MEPEITPAADVQTDAPEGAVQGASEQQSETGLYDLSSVPDHLREHVTPILKEIEGNATKKFQEAAEYRKQWDPYEKLGVSQLQPQELQELLEFRKLVQDENQFKDWWTRVGDHKQWNGKPATEEQLDDDELLFEDGLSRAQLNELINERVQQSLAPHEQRFQQEAYEREVAQHEERIEAEIKGLKDKHGEFDQDAVLQLAMYYGEDPEAVSKGHADYMRLVAGAQQGFVKAKLDQPVTPEQGGQAADANRPQQVRTFEEANQAAVERIRAARKAAT